MRARRSVNYASAAAVALAAVGLWFLWHVSASAADATALFTPDSRSVANRLYVQLHTRVAPDGKEFGIDTLDPLLWSETNYLLEGKSHREALALADEFLRTHAERQVTDPLRRAILQRDIWAVYDWADQSTDQELPHSAERRELMAKLGPIVRRLALSPEQLAALPDTYADALQRHEFPAAYDPAFPNRAFLPPDLFDPVGPWVCLGAPGQELAAPTHDASFVARSDFFVFARLPGGREATLAYYRQLAEMKTPLFVRMQVPGWKDPADVWNPQVPQFPAGTEFALVRRMVLPDRDGILRATKVTESVQIRHYTRIPIVEPGMTRDVELAAHFQDPSEIELSRVLLFSGQHSGLRGVTATDEPFLVFPAMTEGFDQFQDQRMRSRKVSPFVMCTGCHLGPGIESMMSFSTRGIPSEGPVLSPRLTPTTPEAESRKILEWAEKQDKWKGLHGVWAQQELNRPK
jgi:hypothetical protein